MAYLDDRNNRVDGRIVFMTVPAFLFFMVRALQQSDTTGAYATLDQIAPFVNAAVWISPLFVVMQIFRMWEGNASRTWPNIICTLITAAAAVMVWQMSGIRLDLLGASPN